MPDTAAKLYCHRASSASLRVMLYLAVRGIGADVVAEVHTGLETDDRGIMVFTMPEGDAETARLGSTDLTVFNPEGRIPVLLLADGRQLTQSAAILDFIEETLAPAIGTSIWPAEAWARAEARRIMSIVAADIQPYQNIPFIIQAMGEWGMVKATPTVHPLRLHYIRREFGALEGILSRSAGRYAVGTASRRPTVSWYRKYATHCSPASTSPRSFLASMPSFEIRSRSPRWHASWTRRAASCSRSPMTTTNSRFMRRRLTRPAACRT